jgi:4'-phosphopantetheinyl transferase EntD
MPDPKNISFLLDDLYPDPAKTYFSAKRPEIAELLPEEIEFTAGMVEKRRAEFSHGRHCARTAMQRLGIAATAIAKGPDREPVWPAGVIGSISHTHAAAAAVVARSSDMVAVGLDMEGASPLKPDLASMICLPEENPDGDGRRAKLLFSTKEAVYKCLFPLLKEYVDFLEMEIILDEQTLTFSAKPHATRLDPNLIARIRGHYRYHSELVISAAWIPLP